MPGTPVPSLHAEIEISAPPSAVWALVGDVTRMSEWSPQVTSTRLSDGHPVSALGARFTNRNVHGELVWTTHAEIVRYDVDHHLAFRVEENHVIWSFDLSTTPSGTTLLQQRRDAPDGISDLSRDLTEGFMGGQDAFTQTLREGMGATLARIKTDVEAPH